MYDSFNEYRGSYPVSEPYGTLRFLVFSHKKYFAFFSILARKLVCVFSKIFQISSMTWALSFFAKF